MTDATATVIVVERRGFGVALATFFRAIGSLGLRIALAVPFFLASFKWWNGVLKLAPNAADMVQSQFHLQVGYYMTYDLPEPTIAAWIIAFVYVLCPAALVIGFLTRIAAFLLLVLTVLVYLAGWNSNPAWGDWVQVQLALGAMALALVAYGPGVISFDRLIWHRRRYPV